MYLTTYDPFARATRRAFGPATNGRATAMPLDGVRRDGDVLLRFDMPGIDPQSIRKKVSDILLTMAVDTRKAATPEKRRRRRERPEMPTEELERLIQQLEEEMHEAAAELRFEYAARLRDEVNELRRELREAG